MICKMLRCAPIALAGLALASTGCDSPPSAEPSDFLSDTSMLTKSSNDAMTMTYAAADGRLRQYSNFIVEPVEVDLRDPSKANGEQRAMLENAAINGTAAFKDQLIAGFYNLRDYAGAGTARVRVGITDYDYAGGQDRVTIEGEVVDSVTGEQLMAAVSADQRRNTPTQELQEWAGSFRSFLDGKFPKRAAALGGLPGFTGFLSTYANLQPRGEATLAYGDASGRLKRYTKFRVREIQVRDYVEGEVLPKDELVRMVPYMREALIRELTRAPGGYQLAERPGVDVADIRVAMTDVLGSTPILNALPRLKLSEAGTGGMAMEGEMVDSLSGVQLGALVESAYGKNMTFDVSQTDDARAVADDWARRIRRFLDDARD